MTFCQLTQSSKLHKTWQQKKIHLHYFCNPLRYFNSVKRFKKILFWIFWMIKNIKSCKRFVCVKIKWVLFARMFLWRIDFWVNQLKVTYFFQFLSYHKNLKIIWKLMKLSWNFNALECNVGLDLVHCSDLFDLFSNESFFQTSRLVWKCDSFENLNFWVSNGSNYIKSWWK